MFSLCFFIVSLWSLSWGGVIFDGPNKRFGDHGDPWDDSWPWYTDRPIEVAIFDDYTGNPNILHSGIEALLDEVLMYFSDRTCLRFKRVDFKQWSEEEVAKLEARHEKLNYTLVVRSSTLSDAYSRYVGMNKAYTTRNILDQMIGNNVKIGRSAGRFGIVAHEIGHVLGLYHTHQRSDRDKYIRTRKSTRLSHDAKLKTNNLLPYDFGSIMHYPPGDDDFKTVDPLRQFVIGNNNRPTQSDLLLLNKLYRCEEKCASKIVCLHGGFQNPNSCVECVCPHGFSGRLCQSREEGNIDGNPCGATVFAAEDRWYTVKGAPIYQGRKNVTHFRECHWHLTAPEGNNVEVVLTKVGTCRDKTTCEDGGTEVRVSEFGFGGYKFCCNAHLPKAHVFRSTGRLAVVTLDVRLGQQFFELKFRRVLH